MSSRRWVVSFDFYEAVFLCRKVKYNVRPISRLEAVLFMPPQNGTMNDTLRVFKNPTLQLFVFLTFAARSIFSPQFQFLSYALVPKLLGDTTTDPKLEFG